MSGYTKWSVVKRSRELRDEIRDGTRPTLKATAEPDERFLFIRIPELDLFTQADGPDEVEPMARDIVALYLEIPEDAFDLEVEFIEGQPLPEDH